MIQSNIIFCLLIFFSKLPAQPITLTFQIYGSGLSRDIGIRGNTPPLSWEKTYPLTDKDGNGIYESEISFPNLPAGSVVEYKFIQDNKNWESIENRVYISGSLSKSPAISNWNQPTLLSLSDFPKLSAEDMQKDYAIAKKAYLELHPGIYRYSSRESIDAAFNSYATVFNHPMTYAEAYLNFSKMIAHIRCGHTYANFYNQSPLVKELVFKQKDKLPFCFGIIDGKIIITDNLSGDPRFTAGTEIISINDIDIAFILKNLITIVKADGSNDHKRLKDLELTGMGRYEPFDIYQPLCFPPIAGVYKIQAKAYGSNDMISTSVKAISREDRKNALNIKEPTNDELWEYKLIENNIAYLKLGTFVTWQMKINWKAFIDKAFADMEQKRIPHLVIDIRNNEGGDDEVVGYIAKAIANKPVTLDPAMKMVRYQRLPADIEPYLSSWDDAYKKPAIKNLNPVDGLYEMNKSGESKNIPAQKKAYQGQVFLLVNQHNSSATFYLAQIIKKNQLATLVGQTTGGSQRGLNGDQTAFLKLPHSKIELDIPLIGTFYNGKPDKGIEPDIMIKPTVRALVEKRDLEMEMIFELIKL
jgi:Peptidase family S41